MPTITLTDPVTGTTVASGLIDTNNSNLRTLLNSGLDFVNFKGNPQLVSGEVPVWNGTTWVRSTTTNIGPTSLGSGSPSSSNFLRGDGTWAVPPGAMTQIADSTLGGTQASFDTNTILGGNIPGTYNHLRLVLLLRSDEAVTSSNAKLRFNNDGSSIYNHSFNQVVNATVSGSSTVADASVAEINTIGSSGTAGHFSTCEIVIPAYAQTTAHKSLTGVGQSSIDDTAGNQIQRTLAGHWRSTAAITRIQILPNSGNFIAGSRFTLYGLT